MLGIQRFQKQVKQLKEEGSDSILFELEDIDSVMIHVKGPNGTPYQSGIFCILLTNLQDFPYKPPIVFFQTRIWHPLVEENTGRVCPATLTQNWSSYEGLVGFLSRLESFFFCQKSDFSMNAEAASEFQRNDGSFEAHASFFTKKYACDKYKT